MTRCCYLRHTLGSTWLTNAFGEGVRIFTVCLGLSSVLNVSGGTATATVSAQDDLTPVVNDSGMITDDWAPERRTTGVRPGEGKTGRASQTAGQGWG